MIVIELTGNIGEQLFKYAAARNFSLLYNTDLLVDITWYIKNKKAKLNCNKIALGGFKTNFGMAGSVIINKFFKPKQSTYLNRFPNTVNHKVIVENKKEFTNEMYIKNPPFYMNGDFKNEKYFEDNIDAIKEEFSVSELQLKKLYPLIKGIENTNSIAICISSKYITKNNIQQNIEINWTYINTAIKHFESFVAHPHFVIFTDIETNKLEEIHSESSIQIVSLYQNEFEWRNVYLMSKCKYLIANDSATAWWAAWLNTTPNRTVIVPEHFSYAYPEITHNKLGIQQNWIKI
jgi:hypothetical protein